MHVFCLDLKQPTFSAYYNEVKAPLTNIVPFLQVNSLSLIDILEFNKPIVALVMKTISINFARRNDYINPPPPQPQKVPKRSDERFRVY